MYTLTDDEVLILSKDILPNEKVAQQSMSGSSFRDIDITTVSDEFDLVLDDPDVDPRDDNSDDQTVVDLSRKQQKLKSFVAGKMKLFIGEGIESLFNTKQSFVFVVNHNDLFSWSLSLPHVIEFMQVQSKKHGFAIYPYMTWHPVVEKIKPIKNFLGFLGGQGSYQFEDVVEKLKGAKKTYFVMVPESDNCNFIFDDPVAPFKKLGMIKAALTTGVPFFLATFTQDKAGGIHVKFPFLSKVLNKIREGAVGIKLPLFVKSNIRCYIERYDTHVDPDAFVSMGPDEQRRLIKSVGDEIRGIMLQRYRFLSGES